MYQQKGELHMFVFAAVACILLFTLAGSNLFVAQYDSDELSSMGVEEKWQTTTPPPSPTQIEQSVGFFYCRELPTER